MLAMCWCFVLLVNESTRKIFIKQKYVFNANLCFLDINIVQPLQRTKLMLEKYSMVSCALPVSGVLSLHTFIMYSKVGASRTTVVNANHAQSIDTESNSLHKELFF
jgi:hypothetical protein